MLALFLTADLSGWAGKTEAFIQSVTDLLPQDNPEAPFYYTFKVQCTSCRETHLNWVGVSRFESNEISGSKGEANFVWRCKTCKREHSASIKSTPSTYLLESPPKRQKIIEMDCRGLEFIEFKPEGNFHAKSVSSNAVFSNIELLEGEWYDYDEKAGVEVSIRECVWDIGRA